MTVRKKLSLCQTPEISQVIVTAARFTLTNMELFTFLAMINNTAVNSVEHVSCCASSAFLHSIPLGGELLGQELCIPPTVWDNTKLLPKQWTSLHSHWRCVRVVRHILVSTWYDQNFYLLPNRRESFLMVVRNKWDCPYCDLFIGHVDFLLYEVPVQVFAKFSLGVSFFYSV